ncbi:MAG: hypothetical protein JOZ23_17125 [Mycobacterium sp.]|nr:hypothetical protein [Mycobacterium sp.]
MSGARLAKFADETAKRLRALFDAIDRGELGASATMRARIEGALLALDAIASPDPVAALDAMRDSLGQ